MPSALPDGDPVPVDGALPAGVLERVGARPLGAYVHVPFCATRCGYCDFNTYTADELGPGAGRSTYAESAIAEIRLARRLLGGADLPLQSVFFGGGTPTLLAPGELARVLGALREEFGLATGAEVTTEANPDSVDPVSLAELRRAGFTRISFGMQSAVPHVLRTLDRTHDPAGVARAVGWARAAGFDGVSVDLIYGTPGESLPDWQESLEAAIGLAPDHVSAYALVVEDGTRMAGQVRRGELPLPDDDDLADKYVLADELLEAAGLRWYEVSNWARSASQQCRHNLAYWRGDDWWGFGPGAHSHVSGMRWWNVKHPAAYASRLAAGASPAQAREVLDEPTRALEALLLSVRLPAGHPLDALSAAGRDRAGRLVQTGLLEPGSYADGRAALTLRGRLLADAVVRDLAD